MKKILTCILLTVLFCQKTNAYNIYSDIQAGNLIIDKIRNDTLWVRPDLRDTRGDWFYWNFAVSNANDKTLTFIFPSEKTNPNMQYLTARGPALSFDEGWTWSWIDTNTKWERSFSYTFISDKEVRFSMAMPYTQRNFIRFITPYLSFKNVKLDTLAISKGNRVIDRLTLKPIKGFAKHKVLITARHHACEMMANYVLEGMIAQFLKNDWLKENVELVVIPFIDIDGVENGDQGKNRNGHDYNRDYGDSSIYVSTIALRNWIPLWADEKLTAAIDIHCPWIRYEGNEHIFAIGNRNPTIDSEIKKFCNLLMLNNKNELKVSDDIYLTNVFSTTPGVSCLKWISTCDKNFGVKLPLAIEFPYAVNKSQTITQQNAELFGEDIARTLKSYLQYYKQ